MATKNQPPAPFSSSSSSSAPPLQYSFVAASAGTAASAAGQPPLERDTTDTDPQAYQRDKAVAHLKWVWWSSPYFFVADDGSKMNYHDVYQFKLVKKHFPSNMDVGLYGQWVADKKAVLRSYPPGMFVVSSKGPPTKAEAPDSWVTKMASGSTQASQTSPTMQRLLKQGAPSQSQGQSSASTSSAQNSGTQNTASGLQATVSNASAPAAPPAQSLRNSGAAAGTQIDAQTGSVNASGSTTNSQPAQGSSASPAAPAVANPVLASTVAATVGAPSGSPIAIAPPVQQQPSQPGPPVPTVSGAPVVQSVSNSVPPVVPIVGSAQGPAIPAPAPPAPILQPIVQLGTAVGASQLPSVPANLGTVPVPVVTPSPSSRMDFTITGAPLILAPPPQLAQPQVASVGLTANLHSTPFPVQDPTNDPQILASLRQWVLENTGRSDQRIVHTIFRSEVSVLREVWNTVVHHVYWPHGYLCLVFPDYNEAVEFHTEEAMWEDAPRDPSGDVIMGRMCDAPWMGCCQACASPGGFCN
ncbi:hypothetical protein ABW20_dc0108533 [Dactylellina cionopaga]|nr:hypothetical protein ABW20_dc0108533 [Dactylellina cionopaga]